MLLVRLLLLSVLLAGDEPVTTTSAPASRLSARATIDGLLEEAREADSPVKSLEKLREAQAILKQRRDELDPMPLTFLQADLGRTGGVALLNVWKDDRERVELRDRAREALTSASKDFEAVIQLASEEIPRIEKEYKGKDISRHRPWTEAREYLMRAHHGNGWSHYQLGLTYDMNVERSLQFELAMQAFHEFVDGGYYRNPAVIDSFIGSALCLIELEQYADVLKLLEDATRAETPADQYDRIVLIKCRAMYELKEFGLLLDETEAYFRRIPKHHNLTDSELNIQLFQASAMTAHLKRVSNASLIPEWEALTGSLYARGGSIRNRLIQLLGSNRIDVPLGRLADAHAQLAANKPDEARQAAEQGLALLNEKKDTDNFLKADLLHALISASWSLSHWTEVFETSCRFVREHPRDTRAGDICLRMIHAGLIALDCQPALSEQDFFQCLQDVQSQFPELDEAQKLAWYRASRRLAAGQFAEAIAILEKLPPNAADYREGQFGLALAYLQLELRGPTTQAAEAEEISHLQHSRQAIERYVEAAIKRPSPVGDDFSSRVATVSAALGRRLLDLEEPKPRVVLELLDKVEQLRDLENSALDARLALRIEALVAVDDSPAAAILVDQIIKTHADGTQLIKSLTAATTPLEQQLEKHREQNNPDHQRKVAAQLVRLYQFLLESVKNLPPSEQAEQEIAIRRRLAHALRRAEQLRPAIEHYNWLRKRLPRHGAGDVYRGLALAHETLLEHDQAIPLWRALAKGLPKKSPEWYEARYHLIHTYDLSGQREHARKMLSYYLLQDPDIADPYWREQFQRLDRQWR